MTVSAKLDALDRMGMVVLGLLGTSLGLLISSASDIRVTSTLLIMFPGLAVPFLWVGLSEPPQASLHAEWRMALPMPGCCMGGFD